MKKLRLSHSVGWFCVLWILLLAVTFSACEGGSGQTDDTSAEPVGSDTEPGAESVSGEPGTDETQPSESDTLPDTPPKRRPTRIPSRTQSPS